MKTKRVVAVKNENFFLILVSAVVVLAAFLLIVKFKGSRSVEARVYGASVETMVGQVDQTRDDNGQGDLMQLEKDIKGL